MATNKQVRYLLLLLNEKGYPTRFMNSQFKRLGASMRERQGSVEKWLRSLDLARASSLIDDLKAPAVKPAPPDPMARIAAAMVGPQLPKKAGGGRANLDI